MITRDSILQGLGLDGSEGFLIGSLRLLDTDQNLINDVIKQFNEQTNYLGRRISESNKSLYNRLFTLVLTYNEFLTANEKLNNEIYSKNINGYMSYLRNTNKEIASFFLDYFQPYFSSKVRQGHSYATGKTGSGKSKMIEVIEKETIIKNDCSVVLIDPHGDLAESTYMSNIFLDDEQAKRLIIFEPLLDIAKTPVINIFDQFIIKNELELNRIAQEYTNMLTNVFADLGEAPTSRMKTIIGHCITVILRKKDGSILDLYRFMTKNNSDLVAMGCNDPNTITADYFKNEFNDDSYKQTKKGIYDRLNGLVKNGIFTNAVVGKSTINIQDCINNNKVLIANLSRGLLGYEVMKVLGRFIISTIQIAGFERGKIPEYKRPTTHVFIDEFSNYVTDTISEILAELRKYNVFLTLVNQYVGQNLGLDDNKGILGNTSMKIIGQSSFSNSVLISKELGIKPEQITALHRGEFFLQYVNPRTGVDTTIKIKSKTDYLHGKDRIDKDAFERLKTSQLERFYTARVKYVLPTDNDATGNFDNDNKRDLPSSTYKPKGNKKDRIQKARQEVPKFDDLEF